MGTEYTPHSPDVEYTIDETGYHGASTRRSYDMDAAFMQSQRHGWDIHAVWSRTQVVAGLLKRMLRPLQSVLAATCGTGPAR
jgi:hypothetical protein